MSIMSISESNILFKDEYRNETIEFETEVILKSFLIPAAVISLLGAAFVALYKAYIFSLVLALDAAICLLTVKLRSSVKRKRTEKGQSRGNSYMHVYEDRVVVKKPFQKEKVYNISPNQYTITLAHGGGRAYARLVYIFADKHGKRILRYVSDTSATNYEILKQLMKYDIKNVGCRNIFDVVGLLKGETK